MDIIKGKDLIGKKLGWLQKGGLKALERVTGDQSALNVDGEQQDTTQAEDQTTAQTVIGAQNKGVSQDNSSSSLDKTSASGADVVEQKEENIDDELLWSNQYSYDEFIDSLSWQYEERGTKDEEKRHWNYPRRWSVKLFNLKITNLTNDTISCFAEFDFGGSRNECRVQIGSNNYILNRGRSKNYIRTPVLKNVEKDNVRSFNCSHSFEYRGSYLDLENEKLRIKVWKCQTYTINTLESIYEEFLIKFAEGDEHVEILMFKYLEGQKKYTCKLSFNLFFQELYDFEINLINFKIQNSISSYYLFNYYQFYISKHLNKEEQNADPRMKAKDSMKHENWNMMNKLKYSIFKLKMERKMTKINSNSRKMMMKRQKEEEEDDDDDDDDDSSSCSNDEAADDAKAKTDANDTNSKDKKKDKKKEKKEKKKKKKKKRKKKSKIGVGYVTAQDTDENRDTTLAFVSKNTEYISILREYVNLFVQIGTYHPFQCRLPPSPRLVIKLKTNSLYRKKLGITSHSVRNAFGCEWDNLGEILFRGTLSELANSHIEIRLMDWSAPKAASCIGVTKIPMKSIVDYPYINSKFYAPDWLKLKSQYEGWAEHLIDLQLGSVSGSMVVNRKPRYRQLRGFNTVSSSQQLLIVHINNIDQLLAITQESVDSYVEVTFNNVTVRTNLCKDMLGPIYNEELYIPINSDTANVTSMGIGYQELLEMGLIRVTVWGYIMEKLHYFGSCGLGVREVLFNKNVLRPLSKKTHNIMDTLKYETTYETRVYSGSRKLYHYLYNQQDSLSSINMSVWFYPLVVVDSSYVASRSKANSQILAGVEKPENQENGAATELLTDEDRINRLFDIWKRICAITNNEYFIEYCYLFDQYGDKVFPSSFIQVIHPPPQVDTAKHIFHYVSCITFMNKSLQNAFTIDFLLKLKAGNVLDHCILLCSFLLNSYSSTYIALGQQKDKKYNAFLLQYYASDVVNNTNYDGNEAEGAEAAEAEQEEPEKIRGKKLVIFDLVVNQMIEVNLNKFEDSELALKEEWAKREMKKLNFIGINMLFNNKNVWLNVQDARNLLLLDYDINNINNWYPFIPYNPVKNTPNHYYAKTMNVINNLLSPENNRLSMVNKGKQLMEKKYYIDWNKLNDYIVNRMELSLVEELNRHIVIYRSSQNLSTNYNKCDKLQKFLKRYLLMVHEQNISNEDNLKIIKSQINEWKEELERRIPRSYQVLIRTLHFNTVDNSVMFDVIKHRVNFLDSREGTSIFVTTVKIFQLACNLFSTYFLIMYSSKIHEKLRKEILLHRYLVNRKNMIRRSADNARNAGNEEEADDDLELEQLIVDGMAEGAADSDAKEPAPEQLKRSHTKGKRKELVDVVTKNLKMQTRNFHKLKTKQLNNLNSFNSHNSAELSSVSSSSSSKFESEDEGLASNAGELDNEKLMNMPSYEFGKNATVSFSDKLTDSFERDSTFNFNGRSSVSFDKSASFSFSRDSGASLSFNQAVRRLSSSIIKSIPSNSNIYSDVLTHSNTFSATSFTASVKFDSTLDFSDKSASFNNARLVLKAHSSADSSEAAPANVATNDNLSGLASSDFSSVAGSNLMSADSNGLSDSNLGSNSNLNSVLDSKQTSDFTSIPESSTSESAAGGGGESESSSSANTSTQSQELRMNKKLLLNSKIVKNRSTAAANKNMDIINKLDKYSNLGSLDSSRQGSDGNPAKRGFIQNIFDVSSKSAGSSTNNLGSSSRMSSKLDRGDYERHTANSSINTRDIYSSASENNLLSDSSVFENKGKSAGEMSSNFSSLSDFTTTTSSNATNALSSATDEFDFNESSHTTPINTASVVTGSSKLESYAGASSANMSSENQSSYISNNTRSYASMEGSRHTGHTTESIAQKSSHTADSQVSTDSGAVGDKIGVENNIFMTSNSLSGSESVNSLMRISSNINSIKMASRSRNNLENASRGTGSSKMSDLLGISALLSKNVSSNEFLKQPSVSVPLKSAATLKEDFLSKASNRYESGYNSGLSSRNTASSQELIKTIGTQSYKQGSASSTNSSEYRTNSSKSTEFEASVVVERLSNRTKSNEAKLASQPTGTMLKHNSNAGDGSSDDFDVNASVKSGSSQRMDKLNDEARASKLLANRLFKNISVSSNTASSSSVTNYKTSGSRNTPISTDRSSSSNTNESVSGSGSTSTANYANRMASKGSGMYGPYVKSSTNPIVSSHYSFSSSESTDKASVNSRNRATESSREYSYSGESVTDKQSFKSGLYESSVVMSSGSVSVGVISSRKSDASSVGMGRASEIGSKRDLDSSSLISSSTPSAAYMASSVSGSSSATTFENSYVTSKSLVSSSMTSASITYGSIKSSKYSSGRSQTESNKSIDSNLYSLSASSKVSESFTGSKLSSLSSNNNLSSSYAGSNLSSSVISKNLYSSGQSSGKNTDKSEKSISLESSSPNEAIKNLNLVSSGRVSSTLSNSSSNNQSINSGLISKSFSDNNSIENSFSESSSSSHQKGGRDYRKINVYKSFLK